ncbi:hypothetical protein Ahia01_001397100 [Argonauta hians]
MGHAIAPLSHRVCRMWQPAGLHGGVLGETATEYDQLFPHVSCHRRLPGFNSSDAPWNDRRNLRFLPDESTRVSVLDHDRRVDVHGVHMAHVNDVDGSILYAEVPDEVRTQQDQAHGVREDPVRVVRVHRHQLPNQY